MAMPSVFARSSSAVRGFEVEDSLSISISFENGALGTVHAARCATGHLNFDALNQAAPALSPALATVLLTALLLAFLIKAGAFPLYAWLPASYHTLPAPILALFAGLLTKVGVYAVLRTVGDVFTPAPHVVMEALGWVAVATMLFGVLGAAYHWDMRRILAFHIVSQIGYILLGASLVSVSGLTAGMGLPGGMKLPF